MLQARSHGGKTWVVRRLGSLNRLAEPYKWLVASPGKGDPFAVPGGINVGWRHPRILRAKPCCDRTGLIELDYHSFLQTQGGFVERQVHDLTTAATASVQQPSADHSRRVHRSSSRPVVQ